MIIIFLKEEEAAKGEGGSVVCVCVGGGSGWSWMVWSGWRLHLNSDTTTPGPVIPLNVIKLTNAHKFAIFQSMQENPDIQARVNTTAQGQNQRHD